MNLIPKFYVPYFGGGLRNPCRHKDILTAFSKFTNEDGICYIDDVLDDLAQYMWDTGIRGSDDINDFETYKRETLRLFQVALPKRFLVIYNCNKKTGVKTVKLSKLGQALVSGKMSHAEVMIRIFIAYRFPNPTTEFYLNQTNFGINILKAIKLVNQKINKDKEKQGLYKQEIVYLSYMKDNDVESTVDNDILYVRKHYGKSKKSTEFMTDWFKAKGDAYLTTDSSVNGEYCDTIYRMLMETELIYSHGCFGNQLITISPLYEPYVDKLIEMYGNDSYNIEGSDGFSYNKNEDKDDSIWYNNLITLENYIDYMYNLKLPTDDKEFRIHLCEHQEKILELTDGKDLNILEREARIKDHMKTYRYEQFINNIQSLGYNLSQVIDNPYIKEINDFFIDDSVKKQKYATIYEACISSYVFNKFPNNTFIFTKINNSGMLECHAPGSPATSYKGRLGTDGLLIFGNSFANIESTLLKARCAEIYRECDSVIDHRQESLNYFSNNIKPEDGFSILICPQVLPEMINYLKYTFEKRKEKCYCIPVTDKYFKKMFDDVKTSEEKAIMDKIRALQEVFCSTSNEHDYIKYLEGALND